LRPHTTSHSLSSRPNNRPDMVKCFQHTFTYNHPWEHVTLAFWLRYPNPYSRHVVAADVIDRYVDITTGCLHTTRLVLKRGILPSWARKFFNVSEAYILEDTVIDPKARVMRTLTRNITHSHIMQILEMQNITPATQGFGSMTMVKTEARVKSGLGWGLKGRVEGFGARRFADQAARSREGMKYVLERLIQQQQRVAGLVI